MANKRACFSADDASNIINKWVEEDETRVSEYSESYSESSGSDDDQPGVTFVDNNIDTQEVVSVNNNEDCSREIESDESGDIPLAEIASITDK